MGFDTWGIQGAGQNHRWGYPRPSATFVLTSGFQTVVSGPISGRNMIVVALKVTSLSPGTAGQVLAQYVEASGVSVSVAGSGYDMVTWASGDYLYPTRYFQRPDGSPWAILDTTSCIIQTRANVSGVFVVTPIVNVVY